jgi:hypothetical protein
MSQMHQIYGESNSETINACMGTIIGFSSNNNKTLKEWEQSCGERSVETKFGITREPLINATQLRNMPKMTALVMIDKYKYVTEFPYYNEVFDLSSWTPPKAETNLACYTEVKTFNLEKYIKNLNQKKVDKLLGNSKKDRKGPDIFTPFFIDSDDDEDDEKPETTKPQLVLNKLNGFNPNDAAVIIAHFAFTDKNKVLKEFASLPATFVIPNEKDANTCFRMLSKHGCDVQLL